MHVSCPVNAVHHGRESTRFPAVSLAGNISSDLDALADVIAYHIVTGNFTGVSTTYPNTTVGFTLLSDPTVVQLEAPNQHQVVAWATRADGKVHVLNQV